MYKLYPKERREYLDDRLIKDKQEIIYQNIASHPKSSGLIDSISYVINNVQREGYYSTRNLEKYVPEFVKEWHDTLVDRWDRNEKLTKNILKASIVAMVTNELVMHNMGKFTQDINYLNNLSWAVESASFSATYSMLSIGDKISNKKKFLQTGLGYGLEVAINGLISYGPYRFFRNKLIVGLMDYTGLPQDLASTVIIGALSVPFANIGAYVHELDKVKQFKNWVDTKAGIGDDKLKEKIHTTKEASKEIIHSTIETSKEIIQTTKDRSRRIKDRITRKT